MHFDYLFICLLLQYFYNSRIPEMKANIKAKKKQKIIIIKANIFKYKYNTILAVWNLQKTRPSFHQVSFPSDTQS